VIILFPLLSRTEASTLWNTPLLLVGLKIGTPTLEISMGGDWRDVLNVRKLNRGV